MATQRETDIRTDKETLFEIKLSPDERLNTAYSPNFTLSDEIHESFLKDLFSQCQKGGRTRCWRCDAIAVKFTLIKTAVGLFAHGECEKCGSWGVY